MISVRVLETVPRKDGQPPGGMPITPAVYADPLTSGLTYKVSVGINEIEIDLNSLAGPAVLPPSVENEPEEDTDGEASEADSAEANLAGEIDAGEASPLVDPTGKSESTESPIAEGTATEAAATEFETIEEGAK